jgi:hypothetical protein
VLNPPRMHPNQLVSSAKEWPRTSSPAMAPNEPKRVQYVCMPGSPFTGSTLLGTLLNEHPACASIGAATGLIGRTDLSTYQCSCGKLYRECEFWSRVEARTYALGHPVNVFKTGFWNTHLRVSPRRLVNVLLVRSLGWGPLNKVRDALAGRSARVREAIAAMGWNTWSLATAVLEQTGKTTFVDTSRDHQRPKYLLSHPMLDVKVIHLMRDPRGNTASIMKHQGVDAASAARQWRRYNTEAARIRSHFRPESWMSLRYEEFCRDPGHVLNQIFDFLGVNRVSIQPHQSAQERHIIGNKMRLKALGEIREDLSWQTMLSTADLDVIARITGPASRRLGFDWP